MHAHTECCPFIRHNASHHYSVCIHPECDLICQDHRWSPTNFKRFNYIVFQKLDMNEYVTDVYITVWHAAQKKCRVIVEVVLEFHGGGGRSLIENIPTSWNFPQRTLFLCIQLHKFLTYNTLTHIVPLKCGAWCSYVRSFCRLILLKKLHFLVSLHQFNCAWDDFLYVFTAAHCGFGQDNRNSLQ